MGVRDVRREKEREREGGRVKERKGENGRGDHNIS
jgi:hypothetical protein